MSRSSETEARRIPRVAGAPAAVTAPAVTTSTAPRQPITNPIGAVAAFAGLTGDAERHDARRWRCAPGSTSRPSSARRAGRVAGARGVRHHAPGPATGGRRRGGALRLCDDHGHPAPHRRRARSRATADRRVVPAHGRPADRGPGGAGRGDRARVASPGLADRAWIAAGAVLVGARFAASWRWGRRSCAAWGPPAWARSPHHGVPDPRHRGRVDRARGAGRDGLSVSRETRPPPRRRPRRASRPARRAWSRARRRR